MANKGSAPLTRRTFAPLTPDRWKDLETLLKAGFTEVALRSRTRPIMRKIV